MNIRANQQGPITIVSIVGSLDALTAPEAATYLSAQIGKGNKHLVVDLGQVEFMSSAGLRAILAALKESRQQGGDLRIAGASANVEKVLKMSGFTSILKTFATSDEAVASFGS
ncbi:MAG TPA: STAS domain-containing protein [Anaerolineae bacterium]